MNTEQMVREYIARNGVNPDPAFYNVAQISEILDEIVADFGGLLTAVPDETVWSIVESFRMGA